MKARHGLNNAYTREGYAILGERFADICLFGKGRIQENGKRMAHTSGGEAMRNLLTVVCAVVIAAASGANADTSRRNADFYVSPSGSDAWSGTLADPNKQRNDGPFLTLQRARDALRSKLGGT